MPASTIISHETWQRNADGAPMALTVSKGKDGIIQRMYLRGKLIQEIFSERPYRLGQACDGTIDSCVYGLLVLYGRTHRLDLEQLLCEAYPDMKIFSVHEQEAILQSAMRQGIIIPTSWNDQAFDGLLDSLTEINHHCLVDLLESISCNPG